MRQTYLGFSDTNGSPNLSQMTRPSDSEQKDERTCQIVYFAIPADHKVKLTESEGEINIWTFLENWKTMEDVWLIGWFLLHINLHRIFNPKSIFIKTSQFSISTQFKCKYILIEKSYLSEAIRFSQVVLIHLIQFSISTDFVYTQLNVKTVLYKKNQFSVSTVSMSKNSSISNNSV